MKNIIMLLLISSLLIFSGCESEELIEVSSQENLSGNTDSSSVGISVKSDEKAVENSDNEAENEESFRPLVVYVCGQVNKPGVYELNEGSRVIDAIMAAGGYTENACSEYLNLACLIGDGQKVYVPSFEEVESGVMSTGSGAQETITDGNGGVGSSASSGQNASGLININTATKEELMTLPGIGESKAEKIIAYREANGKFKKPEDIMQISGIKEGLYNKIKDKICAQ